MMSDFDDGDVLAGKRVLVVGVSDDEWPRRGSGHVRRASELGVEVVLLGSARSDAAAYAQTVLPVDPTDEAACHTAVQHYIDREPLDGIVTFIEERSEATARLQRDFDYCGHSVWGSVACRDKTMMREILEMKGLPVPRFVHLDDRHEAEAAARWFPTPAFFKPAQGAGSIATRRVATKAEIIPTFDALLHEIQTRIPAELVESLLDDFSEQHANFLLEEYLAPAARLEPFGLGRVGIELLVQNGKIVFFAIADGQCVSSSDHRYATLAFPSRLGWEDQHAFRMLAEDVVTAFGLSDGPVNLDAVMTDRGPQLYEINARIDGEAVLPLIETCYGVDIVEQTLKIAVDSPIDLRCYETPAASALLHFFLAGARSQITRVALPHDLPFENECAAELIKHEGEIVAGPEGTYDAVATVMLTGADRDEVDARLGRYVSGVSIELDPRAAPPHALEA